MVYSNSHTKDSFLDYSIYLLGLKYGLLKGQKIFLAIQVPTQIKSFLTMFSFKEYIPVMKKKVSHNSSYHSSVLI